MGADEVTEHEFGEDKPLRDVRPIEQFRRASYGVRMEYPLNEHVMASVSCAEHRSTEDNYDACIQRLADYLKFMPKHNQVHISYYRSSGS